MEALNELCDLVVAHPDLLLTDKLSWLSSRCTPASASSPQRASRAHLHSLLALACLLPAGAKGGPPPPSAPLLAFLSPNAFLSPAFWPQNFTPAPFLSSLLPLLAAAPASPALSPVLSATLDVADPASAPLARAFLSAAAASAPQLPTDAAPVAARLLFEFPSSEDMPPKPKGKGQDARGEENGGVREAVLMFEEEVEALERKEVAFRLLVQMLGTEGGLDADKVVIDRNAAARVRSYTRVR